MVKASNLSNGKWSEIEEKCDKLIRDANAKGQKSVVFFYFDSYFRNDPEDRNNFIDYVLRENGYKVEFVCDCQYGIPTGDLRISW